MASVRVMMHVMVHVSCSAGRRGSCIYALRRVRAPRAAGLQPLIEQGCATRGGWRIVLRIQLLVLPPEELDELVDELGELPALVAPFRAAGFPPECFHNDSDSESPPVPPPPPWKTSL